jgi:myo-inositol-1(or 4)-monophosphatase
MDQFLQSIIRQAGTIALSYYRKGVTPLEKTNRGDLLTEADIAVSTFLVESIHQRYPEHHICSEELEADINPGAPIKWVIDPIDGTRNFASAIPLWCTLIGVIRQDELYLGAIYDAVHDVLFFAERGKGTYKNGQRIFVNQTDTLDHAYGWFSRAGEQGLYGRYLPEYRRAYERLIQETTVWIHYSGSMLSLGYLAHGAIDFCAFNHGLDHDLVGPVLICQEARAVVTDHEGNAWQPGRQDVVIANPTLHPKLLALFDKT